MKKTGYILTLLLAALSLSIFAQTTVSPKREFRGSWLSTVWAIDWPASRGNTTADMQAQKTEMDGLLDTLVRANSNVCFFQVRGFSDAMYRSKYEPWSQYLCGERGKAPKYDPLQYVIEQGHARGLEVHAWINPLRYATSQDNYGKLPDDYANTHPEWLIDAGGTVILNPAIPEVRQRIVDVVVDILDNYDVDGIVFDDYFYPNGGMQDKYDQEQYEAYNPNNLSRADWRREQINLMVSEVYAAIKEHKPYARFGISPAGVAASSKSVADKYGVSPCPSGSDWQYNGIYSDPLAWLSSQTIDYISPQVYWTIGAGNDYAKIVPWWAMVANKFGRHNYTSASLSSLQSVANAPAQHRAPQSTNYYPEETVAEIRVNRQAAKEEAPGMVFFSTKPMSKRGFISTLTEQAFTHKAIVPAITWHKAEEQTLVTDMKLTGQTLTWSYPEQGLRYAVYAIPLSERNDTEALTTAKYYLGLSYQCSYTLPDDISAATHALAVTVVDRYANEFAPRFLGEQLAGEKQPVLTYPADKADVLLPCVLRWQAIADAAGYRVELAFDDKFEELIAVQTTPVNALSTQAFVQIDGSKPCYWRVKPLVANADNRYSEARSFTGRLFSVISPRDGESEVSVTPTVSWEDCGEGATYLCEVATENTFSASTMVFTQTLTATQLTLPENLLLYDTNYYVRITVTNQGLSVQSPISVFTTQDVVMLPPHILSPADGQQITAPGITVQVEDTPNNGFRFELSASNTFPPRSLEIIETATGETTAKFTRDENYLEDGIYYLRVATLTKGYWTDYSDTIQINYTYHPTAIEDVAQLSVYVAGNALYAPSGCRYALYNATGMLICTGITADTPTPLPALQQGVYCLRVADQTIKLLR